MDLWDHGRDVRRHRCRNMLEQPIAETREIGCERVDLIADGVGVGKVSGRRCTALAGGVGGDFRFAGWHGVGFGLLHGDGGRVGDRLRGDLRRGLVEDLLLGDGLWLRLGLDDGLWLRLDDHLWLRLGLNDDLRFRLGLGEDLRLRVRLTDGLRLRGRRGLRLGLGDRFGVGMRCRLCR